MYSSNSTFLLAGATLLLGFFGGASFISNRQKSARDASWLNGYNRGKAAGQAIANSRAELKVGE